MFLDTLNSILPKISNKYAHANPNYGGCGYSALFIYENFQKMGIACDIVVLSCYTGEQFEKEYAENTINSLDNFESFYPHQYGIDLSHIVVKLGHKYYDLNGGRTLDDFYDEFNLELEETIILQPETLRKMLKVRALWNKRFNRNLVFRIKRDLNLAFKRATVTKN